MNILLTGGLGYLGSVLTPVLLEANHKVRILDCELFGIESITPYIDNVEFQKGDVRESKDMTRALRNMDTVIHLAAIVVTGDKETSQFKRACTEINTNATELLIDLCNKSGKNIRLIFPSSCSLYGHSNDYVDEESPLDLTSMYAISKSRAEDYIIGISSDKIDYTILRLSTLFGNSPRMRFDLLINELTRDAYCKNKIVLKNPQALRPNLYIRDAAKIITDILDCPKSFKQIINVGCEADTMSKENIAQFLQHLQPKLKMDIEEDSLDTRDYSPSFKKLRSIMPVDFNGVYYGIKQVAKAIKLGIFKDLYADKYNNRQFYNKMFGDK